jgi:hypothetical protein
VTENIDIYKNIPFVEMKISKLIIHSTAKVVKVIEILRYNVKLQSITPINTKLIPSRKSKKPYADFT